VDDEIAGINTEGGTVGLRHEDSGGKAATDRGYKNTGLPSGSRREEVEKRRHERE
jgi:hypothetical protein